MAPHQDFHADRRQGIHMVQVMRIQASDPECRQVCTLHQACRCHLAFGIMVRHDLAAQCQATLQ